MNARVRALSRPLEKSMCWVGYSVCAREREILCAGERESESKIRSVRRPIVRE